MTARLRPRLKSLTTATLLGAAGACSAFFAYALTRLEPGTSAVQLTVLYGLPAFLGAGALLALRRTVEARRNILLASASVVFALVTAELFLSLTAPGPQPLGFAAPGADTRSVLEVVRDLRARGVDAFPRVSP